MSMRVDSVSDWRFPPALLGGAFLFAWVNGVFFTPVLLGDSGLAAAMGPYWDVSCVGVFAGLAGLVLAERRLGQVALRRGVQLAAALLQAAGTMVLFLSMQSGGAGSPNGAALVAGCAGAGLAGLAGAVLFVAWGDAYARHPARESEPAIAVSMCLSLLAACLLFGLSGWGAELLVVLLPMGSYGLLRRCGTGQAEGAEGVASTGSAAQPGRWPGFAVGTYIALLWLVLTFTKGTASAELDARSFTEAFFWPFLASTAASFVCLVAYIHFARRISLLSVSRVALPLMCAALVIVMVLPRGAYPAAFAIASVAAMLFDTFLWIHCTNLVRRGVGNPTRVVGGTRAFVQAGAVAVIPFNALAHAAGYEAVAGVLMCALVVAFVVSLTGLVRDEGMRCGVAEPGEPGGQGALGISNEAGRSGGATEGGASRPDVPAWGPATALDRLAAAHGLSSREREVLELLVRGRDLPFIRDELGISRNTVGTHIRHIYQKLDVHSKQELLSLVEDELG